LLLNHEPVPFFLLAHDDDLILEFLDDYLELLDAFQFDLISLDGLLEFVEVVVVFLNARKNTLISSSNSRLFLYKT
jgi:hypothetical protein